MCNSPKENPFSLGYTLQVHVVLFIKVKGGWQAQVSDQAYKHGAVCKGLHLSVFCQPLNGAPVVVKSASAIEI